MLHIHCVTRSLVSDASIHSIHAVIWLYYLLTDSRITADHARVVSLYPVTQQERGQFPGVFKLHTTGISCALSWRLLGDARSITISCALRASLRTCTTCKLGFFLLCKYFILKAVGSGTCGAAPLFRKLLNFEPLIMSTRNG